MKILVVAATEAEIKPLLTHFEHNPAFDVLITGVGMVATAFAIGNHPAIHQYDLLLNLGIAGSLDRGIALGEVIEIIDDNLIELGAEDGEDFIPIEKLGFGQSRYFATAKLNEYTQSPSLKMRTGITVNTVHGNEANIEKLKARNKAAIESMEGAAFFYACIKLQKPGLQIRAVSNYVEKRNRDNWKIGLAIQNLNNFAIELITALQTV